MHNKDARELLKKYKEGTATKEEKELLGDWILFGKKKELDLTDEELELELSLLEKGLPIYRSNRVRLWSKIAAAASVLLIVSVGLYFLLNQKQPVQLAVRNSKIDVSPGHNQATLTLANGQKLILTKGLTGQLAKQGNMVVQINNQNAITYTSSNLSTSAVLYNTLSTTKGEQSPYPLILADGSKVWLNAMSSITFPTSFNGKDRLVKITGEAYFEVVHNAIHPFKVSFKGQTVEDIGTQFNINAYDDEPVIKTTLIEGSVRLSKDLEHVILNPGQQAITTVVKPDIEIQNTDINEVIAWKNGLFNFNNTDIEDVMRQLSRWYNVDVSYPNGIPKMVFTGEMHRNVNASQILYMLSYFKVHFQIVQGLTGKKIIVKP